MTKEQKAHVRDLIASLASVVIGSRPDRALLLAVLVRNLTVEVSDFLRYHGIEHAASRVRDHEILLRSPVARRTNKKRTA